MNNFKANMSLENGSVVLSLDTYNAMFRKADLLESIVDDTVASIVVSTNEPSEYNKLCVSIDGSFKLPQMIRDELTESVCQMLIANPAHVRTLVENNTHYLDLCDFSLNTYRQSSNTMQVDLLSSIDFKEAWDAAAKKLASEKPESEKEA
jgi:hypothetical protein